MKTILLILLTSAIIGCRNTDRPDHNWRPPGMLMQNQTEGGML